MRGSDRQAAQRRHPAPPRFFVRSAVALLLCLGRVLVLGARERSERVTTRRQPPRQRSRRTCIKTSTRPIVTYLPYLGIFPRFYAIRNIKKGESEDSPLEMQRIRSFVRVIAMPVNLFFAHCNL